MTHPLNRQFISLASVAHQCGVSAAWMRREVEAGNIPHLLVGKQIKMNVNEVKERLYIMAEERAADIRKQISEDTETNPNGGAETEKETR